MKNYSHQNQNKPFTLFGFLTESKAALLIILTNVAVFVFLQDMAFDKSRLSSLVLYPSNLINHNYACLITAGFLHHNWTHLLLNMLGVFIFGRIVERHLGILKTFFVYIGALFFSMLFSATFYAFVLRINMGIIGASGAAMGLLGAAMLLDPFCITYEMILPIPVMIKGWMFLYADLKGFLGGEKDGVSHLAHLFGIFSVVLLMYLLSHSEKKKMHIGLLINIISFGFFLVLWHKLGYRL